MDRLKTVFSGASVVFVHVEHSNGKQEWLHVAELIVARNVHEHISEGIITRSL
jgi:hypothetical protein